MNHDLLETLKELRNAIAHQPRRPDLESLANGLAGLKVAISPADVLWFVSDVMRGSREVGEYLVPRIILDVIPQLLEGQSATTCYDPCAGIGVIARLVHEAVQAKRTIACTRDPKALSLGRVVAPDLDWRSGDPLEQLGSMSGDLDVVVSVLPFNVRPAAAVTLRGSSGECVRFSGDVGSLLLAASSLRLSPQGVGIFLVTPSFFFAESSILRDLPRLGLGVAAALAVPAGSFAPYACIPTYLVVVRKRMMADMFVAQLTQDPHTNRQVVANLRGGKVDGALELGRFAATEAFHGFEAFRLDERLRQAERQFKCSAVRLGQLAKAIQLGRPSREFAFSGADNALYIPLIGTSDVVDSPEVLTLKPQNYAQVVVDKMISDALFVARFLNSELGRSLREANKSGMTIRKLNTTGLKDLPVFVPHLSVQRKVIEVEAQLTAQQNTVLGLQNDLASIRRELWNSPERLAEVESKVRAFAGRLALGAAPHVAATLDQWFETLPFPLASILRAWQATPRGDYKQRYEHLLHFFEALAQFVAVVFLSAYSTQGEDFVRHRSKLSEIWKKNHLCLERATFGTWKVVVEYMSKQTRALLCSDTDKRMQCAEIFADPTLCLPEMLSRSELAVILGACSKMRNDWTGHGGVVSPEDSRLRNEVLLSEVQKVREVTADGWSHVQLVRSIGCRPRRGMFENELAVLVGSNCEFLKESRSMSSWLDVDRLYLVGPDSGRALLLLPLMQVGPSPSSAKNACYFFNRLESGGARFVSYHFLDRPELKEQFEEAAAAIRFLTEGEPRIDN